MKHGLHLFIAEFIGGHACAGTQGLFGIKYRLLEKCVGFTFSNSGQRLSHSSVFVADGTVVFFGEGFARLCHIAIRCCRDGKSGENQSDA